MHGAQQIFSIADRLCLSQVESENYKKQRRF
jgi:hypothetical protein